MTLGIGVTNLKDLRELLNQAHSIARYGSMNKIFETEQGLTKIVAKMSKGYNLLYRNLDNTDLRLTSLEDDTFIKIAWSDKCGWGRIIDCTICSDTTRKWVGSQCIPNEYVASSFECVLISNEEANRIKTALELSM